MSIAFWLLEIAFLSALHKCYCVHNASHFSRNRQFQGTYGPSQPNVPIQTLMSRNVCRGRTGYVADTSRNCQVFYNCLPDGTITTSTCPGDYLFDERTQCCKMPHDVNCAGFSDSNQGVLRPTVACTGKRGFYPDISSGCKIFYFCEPSGRSRQLSCPDGLLFNEIIGCCDISQNVRCGGAPLPQSTSPVPVDGGELFCRNHRPGFYTNPTDCSTYYYCQNNNRHSLLRCPSGQAFNELTSSCDNDLGRCNGVQIDRRVFDCTGRGGWYAGNDPNCQYAFYCNGGSGYMHICPVNLRWNAFTLSCESKERVQCPRNGNTGSGQTVIIQPPITPVTTRPIPQPPGPGGGYGIMTPTPYGDYGQFTTPRLPWNGNGITYPSVPIGTTTTSTYFTYSSTQQTTNTNPGLGTDRNYDCRGKIGYYAIVESGCSQFIYCNPEGLAHRFACPSVLLFNNSLAVCDWPQNVRCQNQYNPGFLPNTLNPPNFDCRGKNGFFADRTRGSRLFYMCHSDGVKFQYVCPANLAFNEQTSVCDWPDYMKQGGFSSGSQTGGRIQTAQVQWNGPPIDCRLRPAGYYANPTNNQIYARCTPDGTFITMPCPQATVFDQGLGLCVFPYQAGQVQTGGQYQQAAGQTQTGSQNQQGAGGQYTYQQSTGQTQTGGQYQQGSGQMQTGGQYQQNTGQSQTGGQYQQGGNVGVYDNSGSNYNTNVNDIFRGTAYRENYQTGAINEQYQQPPPVPNTATYRPPPVTTTSYVAQLRPYTGPGSVQRPPPVTTVGYDYNQIEENYGNNQYQFSTEPNGFVGTYPPYIPPQTLPPAPINQNFQSGNSIDSFFQGEQYGMQSGSNQFVPPNKPSPDYGYGQLQQVNYQQTGQSNNYQSQGGNYGGQPQPHPGYVPQQQTPAVCMGAAGLYADRASSCRRYFVCQSDGSGSIRVCPGTTVFNERTGKCENSRNVNCFTNAPGIVQPSVPVCMNGNSANKFVPDPSQGCMTFYNCEQNGRGTGFRCPAGMQFNTKINACDDPRNCNCIAENGGTINIKIPVPTTVVGTSDLYRSNLQGYSAEQAAPNQNMDLDIRVRRPVITSGMLPLVPGYDASMYADASGTHARLPSFLSDDDSLSNSSSAITLDIVIGPPSKINTTLESHALADTNKVDGTSDSTMQADDPLPGDNYFRLNTTKNKSLEKVFKILTERQSKDSLR